MSALLVRLFGKPKIQRDEQVLDIPNTSKVLELFAYLLLYRDRPHRRETLAALFWNRTTTTRALKYLRQTLWQLQTALDCTNRPEAGDLFLIDPEWIGLNPQADLWLDAAALEQAFGCVQGIRGQQLDPASAQTLQNAVQLYQGDLLEGWYQDWCLYERERLQNLYLAILDKLMGYCETHHKYEAGVMYGTRVLKYDRARERTHRRLMRLYYLAGNRTSALRQFEICAAALQEELSVVPATSTATLYEQIREDQLDGLMPTGNEANLSLTTTVTLLPKIVKSLKQLHEHLSDVRHQVEQDIQTVEAVLDGQADRTPHD